MLFGELFVYVRLSLCSWPLHNLTWVHERYDMGQAVMFGRPPAIGGSYYDVRPYIDETTTPETDCTYLILLLDHNCTLISPVVFSQSTPGNTSLLPNALAPYILKRTLRYLHRTALLSA
jgi:hypothetical protein